MRWLSRHVGITSSPTADDTIHALLNEIGLTTRMVPPCRTAAQPVELFFPLQAEYEKLQSQFVDMKEQLLSQSVLRRN